MSAVSVRDRAYLGEADDRRLRSLLTATRSLTPQVHNWHLVRWDAFRFGRYGYQELSGERTWEQDVRLWETASGQLVGAVHPEAAGNIFLQIHPNYRHLEPEMLAWAETHHAAARPADADRWPLNTFVHQGDRERARLLAMRGYESLGPAWLDFRFPLTQPVPRSLLPEGYCLRPLRRDSEADVAGFAGAINRVFGADFSPPAVRVLMGAPTRHQDLAVFAPDGTLASFCTIWLDEANRAGAFEPVGTDPGYRRRGLGRAMMWDALHRLRDWGAIEATVDTGYRAPAASFYRAVGFSVVEAVDRWRKWL